MTDFWCTFLRCVVTCADSCPQKLGNRLKLVTQSTHEKDISALISCQPLPTYSPLLFPPRFTLSNDFDWLLRRLWPFRAEKRDRFRTWNRRISGCGYEWFYDKPVGIVGEVIGHVAGWKAFGMSSCIMNLYIRRRWPSAPIGKVFSVSEFWSNLHSTSRDRLRGRGCRR